MIIIFVKNIIVKLLSIILTSKNVNKSSKYQYFRGQQVELITVEYNALDEWG
jgi:hypothetical protein